MKRVLILLSILLLAEILPAQPAPDTLWTRTYGGTGNDFPSMVKQTLDGGYVIVGNTYSFGGMGSNMYIVKTSREGHVEWETIYDSGNNDGAAAVDQLIDSSYIVAGYIQLEYGYRTILLLHLSPNGDTLSTHTYHFYLSQNPNAIVATGDGGFLLFGAAIKNYIYNAYGAFVMELDENGDSLWTTLQSAGSGYPVSVRSHFSDAERRAGYGTVAYRCFQGLSHDAMGHPEIWTTCTISRYDENGSLVWYRDVLGSSGYRLSDRIRIALSSTNTIFCLAYNDVSSWVRLTSLAGDSIATYSISFSAIDVAPGPDEGYLLVSYLSSLPNTVNLDGFDTFGQHIFCSYYTTDAVVNPISVDALLDSCYLILAYKQTSTDNSDILLIKTERVTALASQLTNKYIPSSISLISAYPNPFNAATTLVFTLSRREKVRIDLFDLNGRMVKRIVSQEYEPGQWSVPLNASDLSSGLYFARMMTPGYTGTHKLMLIK